MDLDKEFDLKAKGDVFFLGGEGWGRLENLCQQSFVNVHTHSDLSIECRHTQTASAAFNSQACSGTT